jgi:thymidylate synthase ThyX
MGIYCGRNAYLLLPDYEEVERVTITAKVIADSIAEGCPRLTTLQLRYPRFIHSEVMTHRAFSRNASSSRAIPIERLIQDVIDDPAVPIYWGANKPGMQAGEELESGETEWILARDTAIHHAQRMARMGYHKQIVNRILEPFAHINLLVTATADAYAHFFALRDHPDAQPEIAALARAMRAAISISTPDHMSEGEWHLPYITADDCFEIEHEFNDGRTTSGQIAKAISSARCASVSYKTVDGKPMTIDKALKIYDKLAGSDPIHASPFEHIARPAPQGGKGCRNFDRWHQWRADIET